MPDLQPLQFKFEHQSQLGYPDREHALYAFQGDTGNPGNYRGMMSWHPETGEIGFAHVGPAIATEPGQDMAAGRRQGVGTALLRQAQFEAASRGLAQPQHSDDLSEDGEAFAKARPV